MADGSLIFDTSIDQKGFKDGLSGLEGVAKKGFSVVTGLAAAAGTSMLAVASASIKVGMNFEASMSQVAATMGITVDEIANGSESFELLEQAAKDAGATTMFSASQSAEALNYLALAGYDAEKSVNALPTVLNLAAAGGLDLAYASDLVTDSMSALGMESDQLEGFVDQLAKTSQKSNTSVAQLGEAILTVGGTAKILAGGTTELNAQLGILADNGIKGSEGGTALRNVLLALSAPTEKQAEQMQKLGISAYDANGNLRPTNEIFQDLNSELSTMTQQERTEVLNNLFNKVDLKAANALLANSGERFNELSGYIDNADGAAAAMAETLNDNLKGKITILGSSLEGLGIQIYEGMEAPLKGAVEMAIDYVGQLSKAFEEEGFAGVMNKVGDIVAEVLVKIAAELPKLIDMGKDMILNFIQGIQDNSSVLMGSAADIITSLVSAVIDIFPEIIILGMDLLLELAKGLTASIPTLITSAVEALMSIVSSFYDNIGEFIIVALDIIMALVEGIMGAISIWLEMAPLIIEKLVAEIENNLPMILQAAMDIMLSLMEGIVKNADLLIDAALMILDSLINFVIDNLELIIDMALTIVLTLIDGLLKNLDKLVDASLRLVTALIEGLTNNMPLVIDAGIRAVLALIDGILKALPQVLSAAVTLVAKLVQGIVNAFPQLIGLGLQTIGKLIGGLLQALPQLLSAAGTLVSTLLKAFGEGFKATNDIGKNIVEGIWEGITGAGNWLMGKVKGFADGVVKGIKGFFGIKSPSTRMKKEVGPELSAGIGEGIEDGMPDLKKGIDKEMMDLTRMMKATVDLESASVGKGIVSSSMERIQISSSSPSFSDSQLLARLDKLIEKDTSIKIDGREVARATAQFTSNELARAKKLRRN